MIYFNLIKLREASIALTSFVQKHENYSDFLCMNAMHTSGFSLFLSSNAGMLHCPWAASGERHGWERHWLPSLAGSGHLNPRWDQAGSNGLGWAMCYLHR